MSDVHSCIISVAMYSAAEQPLQWLYQDPSDKEADTEHEICCSSLST